MSQSKLTSSRRGFMKFFGAASLGLSLAWGSSIVPAPWAEKLPYPLDPNSRPIDENYRVTVKNKFGEYDFNVQTPLLRAKIDKFYGRPPREHASYPVQEELLAMNNTYVAGKRVKVAPWQTNLTA